MFYITKNDYSRIIEYSKDCLPNEACGLIAGIEDNGGAYVKKVYLLSNTDESSCHFFMDVKEQFAAVKDIRAEGLRLLGNFHSHPCAPAVLSEEDKRLAYDPAAYYLVLSLADMERPALGVFKIDRNKYVTKEEWILCAS